MSTYLTIIFFTIILSVVMSNQNVGEVISLKQKMIQRDKIIICIIGIILIFFAGFRYRVGADYLQYAANYEFYCISELDWLKEPGIRIIAKLSSFIYSDFSTMFFIMSLITVGLCIWSLIKNTPFWTVSILLYIFLGSWHESFNSVRQSAAAAILFFGHNYIKERKFLKWLIVCLIASVFHISAIVFLPLYWLPTKQFTFPKMAVFFFVGIVLAFSYDPIWELIGFMQGEEFVIDGYSKNSISIFRIIVAWVPPLFYMLFIRNSVENEDREKINFYASLSLVSAAIVLAARYSAYLGRMVIYTDIYNAIFWAFMLKSIFKKQKDIKERTLYILLILGCYFVYYLFEASGEFIVNYQTIFSR